jgi:hypothetical protein
MFYRIESQVDLWVSGKIWEAKTIYIPFNIQAKITLIDEWE